MHAPLALLGNPLRAGKENVITTPEIERLTKWRDHHRNTAQQIERHLQDLRRKERERMRQAKAEAKSNESRVKRQDQRSVVNEMHRLRVMLADAMKANGAKTPEIEKAIGIRKSGLRLYRIRLERLGILSPGE